MRMISETQDRTGHHFHPANRSKHPLANGSDLLPDKSVPLTLHNNLSNHDAQHSRVDQCPHLVDLSSAPLQQTK